MNAQQLLQGLASGVIMGLVYALISVGLSLIFGVMEVVNFAHGEHLMLGMFGAFFLWKYLHLDPLFSLPLLALALGLLGALTYRFVIKKVYDAPPVMQIFATFGMSVLLSSLAQALWTPNYRTIQKPLLEGSVHLGSVYIGRPELAAAVISVLTFLALRWFLNKTEVGLALQATAEDKQTAFLMGINGEKMFSLGWGIGLACVGVTGGLMASFFYIYPAVGDSFGLLSYVAVAIGGFGNIMGAFAGGLLIGIVESMTGTLIDPALKYVGVFVVYLIVVSWRPQGLLGKF